MLNTRFVELTSESLKKITFGIHSLQQSQREMLREKLHPYIGKKLWEADLRHLLHEFKEHHALSNIDLDEIKETFFSLE